MDQINSSGKKLLTREEANLLCGDKTRLYLALYQNGNFLPSEKSPMTTLTYLLNVHENKFQTMTIRDVRKAPCHDKPAKFVILHELLKAQKTHPVYKNYNFGIKWEDRKKTDKIWMLEMLSTIDPNHRFFQRSYVPSPAEKYENPPAEIVKQAEVRNIDGSIFEGLPFKKRSKGARGVFRKAKDK